MTTYAALVTWADGLTISGVTREYDHAIASTYGADLPAKYVRLPGGGINRETVTTCAGDGKMRSIEIVILVEAMGQNNPEPNFEATVTLMDAAETALDASVVMPITNYSISAGSVTVGGVDYWAIVVAVEGIE